MVKTNEVEVKVRKENKKDTPQDIIDRMNEAHTEWKKTKQIKYDRNGKQVKGE